MPLDEKLSTVAELSIQHADNRYSTYLYGLSIFLAASLLTEFLVLSSTRFSPLFLTLGLGIIPLYFLVPVLLSLTQINRLRRRLFFATYLEPVESADKLLSYVKRLYRASDNTLVFLMLAWVMLFVYFLFFILIG